MKDSCEPANAVMLERSFEAPIDLIWAMWTDADHFKAWYGPRGATIPVAEFDVRVGGNRFVGMEMATPGGLMRMWFVGEHLVVDVPARLVFSESMSDESGNAQTPASMGMPPGYPTTTEVSVELAETDGCTRMVLRHEGIPADSPGAMGWKMALDKLTAYVDAQVSA